MMSRLLKVAAASLGLLVLAVAVELWQGSWFVADPLDPLGLPRDRQVPASAAGLYPDGGDFAYRRDHWGFRGDHFDPARITILTIGGDSTDQSHLPEDKTWQQVMERQFHAGGRPEVVVANAGFDGQSTIGALQALHDWFPQVPDLHPRFVLASVGVNDTQPGEGWVDSLRDTSLETQVRRKSALYRLWRRLADRLVPPATVPPRHQAVDFAAAKWTEHGRQALTVGEASLARYRLRLKEMADRIHAMGAVPVFVTQSRGDFRRAGAKVVGLDTESGPNGIDQYNALAPFNAATRETCREHGLLCLDLGRELGFEDGDFYDYLHNSPAGAEKIGRWLHAKLAGLV